MNIQTSNPKPLIPSSPTYNTADYLYELPDLAQYMMIVEFPQPFTVGHYRKWMRACMGAEVPKEYRADQESITFYAQLVGALAVCNVIPHAESVIDNLNAQRINAYPDLVDEEPMEENDEFTFDPSKYALPYAAIDPHLLLPENIEALPIAVRTFLVRTADKYIGDKLFADNLVEVRNRRVQQRQGKKNFSPGFQHDHLGDKLPDMVNYKGFVVYKSPVTTASYGAWTAAIKKMPVAHPINDVDNQVFLRQLRGVGAVKEDFRFKRVGEEKALDWNALKANDFDKMPLELATFLVDTLDEYIGRHSSLKV